ncbi:hypothetical protein [Candidatus Pyrohabitans sp.]
MEHARRELDYLRSILSDSRLSRLDVASNLQVVLYHYARHLLVPEHISEEELRARLAEKRPGGHPLYNLIELMEEKGLASEEFSKLARRVAEVNLRVARDAEAEVSRSELEELLLAIAGLVEADHEDLG